MEVERHAVHALRALDRDESRLACLEISEIETVSAGTDGELLLPLRRVCPVSTMTDLLKMVEESDKVLVFG